MAPAQALASPSAGRPTRASLSREINARMVFSFAAQGVRVPSPAVRRNFRAAVVLGQPCKLSSPFLHSKARKRGGNEKSRRYGTSESLHPSLLGRRHPTGAVAMFTGIVEEMGVVERLEQVEEPSGQLGWTLQVRAEETLQGTKLGDSISVNGTCLTVTSLTPHSFTFGVSPETLRCTSLGELEEGAAVNLERSMQPDGRMGGHFVQGHVDATGTILAFWEEGDSLWVRVQAPHSLMPYIVPKGYIAVDGTSLTVCEVNDKEPSFTFMLVAYTQQKIVVAKKPVGSKVNLEVDILGKYVGRMMTAFQEAGRIPSANTA